MAPKFKVGQRVIVATEANQQLSARDTDLLSYRGLSGKVTDFYWITKDRGAELFYIYNVKIDDTHKEVVLHEDEILPYSP